MKQTHILGLSLLSAAALHAGEITKHIVNADQMAEGDPPKEVFVVDGTIKIGSKDGNKAIVIEPNPITDASAQLAVSAAGDSSIQARVFASRRARSSPKFGVSVHGMSGYRLLVNAPKKQLELVKSDEVIQSVPFAWTPDSWTVIKLEVKKAGEKDWSIIGKAWPSNAEEPAEPQIKHSDNALKGQGKAGVWGTPYSELPIYFDDVEMHLEASPATP